MRILVFHILPFNGEQGIQSGFLPKVKLEIITDDENMENVIGLIYELEHTGEAGDGKIFVDSVDDVMRVRTIETTLWCSLDKEFQNLEQNLCHNGRLSAKGAQNLKDIASWKKSFPKNLQFARRDKHLVHRVPHFWRLKPSG